MNEINKMNRAIIRAGALLGLAAGLWACTSGPMVPAHYYVLTAMPSGAPPAAADAARGPSIQLTRVTVPEYLNQLGIVTRIQANQVARAENDLWAGQLADEITRAIGENLSVMLPTDRLFLSGNAQATSASYTVEIEIVTYERDPQNTVNLVARWGVTRNDGRTLVAMRRSSYQQSAGNGDYPNTVAAMSQALGTLCQDIANTIKRG
jgi:uncharacterized lipoprotein YmbA